MVKYDNNAKTPEETANSKQQEHVMQRGLGREPIEILPALPLDLSGHIRTCSPKLFSYNDNDNDRHAFLVRKKIKGR